MLRKQLSVLQTWLNSPATSQESTLAGVNIWRQTTHISAVDSSKAHFLDSSSPHFCHSLWPPSQTDLQIFAGFEAKICWQDQVPAPPRHSHGETCSHPVLKSEQLGSLILIKFFAFLAIAFSLCSTWPWCSHPSYFPPLDCNDTASLQTLCKIHGSWTVLFYGYKNG